MRKKPYKLFCEFSIRSPASFILRFRVFYIFVAAISANIYPSSHAQSDSLRALA